MISTRIWPGTGSVEDDGVARGADDCLAGRFFFVVIAVYRVDEYALTGSGFNEFRPARRPSIRSAARGRDRFLSHRQNPLTRATNR